MLQLPRLRNILWAGMLASAFVVAVLNSRFLWTDIRSTFHHSVDHLGQRDFSLYLHLYTAPFILVVGALLFHKGLRQRYRSMHRWVGRIYLATVIASSAATLHLSVYADGGALNGLSFGAASILWFATAAIAWGHALGGRYEEHAAWMVRNYALTLTNVTFRIDLHGLLWLGMDVSVVYDVTRALQPVQNLIIAEVLIHTRFFDSMSWTQWWNAISHLPQPAPKAPDDGQPPELSSEVSKSPAFLLSEERIPLRLP